MQHDPTEDTEDAGSAEAASGDATSRGPIAWMAKNSVAANLLMFIIMVGGLLGISRTKQEVFPEFDLDVITVSVPYPGASPEEVEQGIVLAVEEAVRGLDGVKRVTSSSAEGAGTVSVELLLEADPDKVLADVKSAVDRIRSFPEESEDPNVSLLSGKQSVISLIFYGEQDLSALHTLAERTREQLLLSPDVTQVEVFGVPPLEVAIELPRQHLESLGLTLDDVARQITAASLELPGGAVDTSAGQLLVRVSDRARSARDFEGLVLRSTIDGAQVRLGDVATITDGYEDNDQASFYNGMPAVRLTAYRVGDETPQQVSEAVRAEAARLEAELPGTVSLAIWDDNSEVLKDRIRLLVSNARSGLVLVLVVLALFLNLRLAFWVALGIPVSFLGAFLLLPGMDMSVNMITLFALIVTLGMVVDDAIVVGENVFSKTQAGMPPMKAAVEGAQQMAVPVTFAILTTIAAFSPMFFVPGVMGKIFRLFPAVVISVLLFSLAESFFVLPAHLMHSHAPHRKPTRFERLVDFAERPGRRVSAWLERMIETRYKPTLAFCLDHRYTVWSGALALFMLTIGLVGGGVVPFNFFPTLEGDVISASVRMPYGAPVERTLAAREALEASLQQTIDELPEQGLVLGTFTRVGEISGGGGPAGDMSEVGGHLLGIEVNLVGSGEREISAEEFAAQWSKRTPPIPGAELVSFNSSFGPGAGAAVDIQLMHSDADTLAEASGALTEALRGYSDLTNIENGYAAGKPQLDFRLLDRARSLGLTNSEVARQLRSAFYGAEALREQRGRNELKVMVRLPEAQRRSEFDLEQLQIRTPDGGFVPLLEVASFDRGRAPTSIQREEGRRKVNVAADLAPGVASSRDVLSAVTTSELPALQERYPGLTAELAGQQREQAESFAALGQNYVLALFVIFALLAVPFRSYTQPLIIMSAIPFGFIGAVMGHLLMGYAMSLISMFGIIALSGVVVNDSLVLIDAANQARREGRGAYEAIISAGARRLRPILLTSLTTFFGLAPMILETSVQARFLIPMAISLGFGVLFATVITLLIVPALYLVLEDAAALSARLRGVAGGPAEVVAAAGK
jgi:multidrug efflux pump subunit AcrB